MKDWAYISLVIFAIFASCSANTCHRAAECAERSECPPGTTPLYVKDVCVCGVAL